MAQRLLYRSPILHLVPPVAGAILAVNLIAGMLLVRHVSRIDPQEVFKACVSSMRSGSPRCRRAGPRSAPKRSRPGSRWKPSGAGRSARGCRATLTSNPREQHNRSRIATWLRSAGTSTRPQPAPTTPLFPWVPAGGYPDQFPFGQCTGHARQLAARLMDLQLAAADSAGLATDTDTIVNTQEWMLYQLRLLDDQIEQVEAAIGAVLRSGHPRIAWSWPASQP